MKAVVIGTRAYKNQGNDLDIICDEEFASQLSGCERREGARGIHYWVHGKFEATVPKPGTAYEMVLKNEVYQRGAAMVEVPGKGEVFARKASIPTLIALKKAHLILPRRWEHHIAEYRDLKRLVCLDYFRSTVRKTLGDEYGDLYLQHRKECLETAKAHPRLNTMKDEFFEEARFKIFDHDSIHRAIALGPKPAYTEMLDGEVWCSRKKWREMSEEKRFHCVIEEAAILALERAIIPSLYYQDVPFRGADWAFKTAMFKICTTITSGWFRDYCIERYWDALEARPDFVKAFFNGVKLGIVKVLKPEVVYGK